METIPHQSKKVAIESIKAILFMANSLSVMVVNKKTELFFSSQSGYLFSSMPWLPPKYMGRFNK